MSKLLKMIGRPRLYSDNAERQRAYRQRRLLTTMQTQTVIATIRLSLPGGSLPGQHLKIIRWLEHGTVMVETPLNPQSGWVLLRHGEYQLK